MTEKDYEALLARKTVSEVTLQLKQTALYAKDFEDIDERFVHRQQLETLLKKSLYQDLKSLKYFAGSSEKKILDAYYSQSELAYIMRVIRSIQAGSAVQKNILIATDMNASRHSEGVAELATATSLDEFVQLLEKTKYAGAFSDMDLAHADYAAIDIALTSKFFSLLFKFLKKYLSAADCRLIQKRIGTEIDIRNISCILRLKEYFPEADFYQYLLPYGKFLSKEKLISLAHSSDFLSDLKTDYPGYAAYFSTEKKPDDSMDKIEYQLNRTLMLAGQPSICVVLAYLSLREIEIKNIIHIVEGVRYGTSVENIRNCLVGVGSQYDVVEL